MEALRDPIWQFLGVIVAMFTIMVTIIYSKKSPVQKRIKYRYLFSDVFFTLI